MALEASLYHFCISCKGLDATDLLKYLQAEARQAKFDSTPGGRAARKAVANVAREREADAAANAARGNDNAKDWLS